MEPPGGHGNLGPPPDYPPPSPPKQTPNPKQALMQDFKQLNKRVPAPPLPTTIKMPQATVQTPTNQPEEKKGTLSKALETGKGILGKKEKTFLSTPEERFTKTINLLNETVEEETVCRNYKERQQRAKQARAAGNSSVADTLDKFLSKELDGYEFASKRLAKIYAKNKISSSADLELSFGKDLAELLRTPTGLDFVASMLLQIKPDQERSTLVKVIVQQDVFPLKNLLKILLVNSIKLGSDPTLRQPSLTLDLFRELHFKVYGPTINPIISQFIQRHIIDTHGKLEDRREVVAGLLVDLQTALRSQVADADALHILYALMRKTFGEQVQSRGKETPLMINIFLLRVICPLILNPNWLGLPPYPEGNFALTKEEISPESEAAKSLFKELMAHVVVKEAAKDSLKDELFGPLLKDLLTILDPPHALEITRYGSPSSEERQNSN